jgi:hypothetical protein
MKRTRPTMRVNRDDYIERDVEKTPSSGRDSDVN